MIGCLVAVFVLGASGLRAFARSNEAILAERDAGYTTLYGIVHPPLAARPPDRGGPPTPGRTQGSPPAEGGELARSVEDVRDVALSG